MLTDYHTHSYRCGHASGTMEEYIEVAVRRGIGEIGLSDHLFMYFDDKQRRASRWAISEQDYDTHYQEMCMLRDRYRGRINVRVSVEADYFPGFESDLERILSRYEFDYVLGSVHFLGGWMIDDAEQAHRYAERSVAQTYREYYTTLQQAIRLDVFDLLAHFDLPKKFGYRPEDEIGATVKETLDLVRDHDIAIEVSTAGLRKPVGEIYPERWILEEMKKRNIPVALSSDAHAPDEVGADYDRSLTLLHEAGYQSLAVFEARSRSLVPV